MGPSVPAATKRFLLKVATWPWPGTPHYPSGLNRFKCRDPPDSSSLVRDVSKVQYSHSYPHAGLGYPLDHFWHGIHTYKPNAIIVDSGSTDPGPYLLGTGLKLCSKASYIRDLTPIATAGIATGFIHESPRADFEALGSASDSVSIQDSSLNAPLCSRTGGDFDFEFWMNNSCSLGWEAEVNLIK
jgi:hypothetical protein